MPRRIKKIQNLTASAPAGKAAGKKKVLISAKKKANKTKAASKGNVKIIVKSGAIKKKPSYAKIPKKGKKDAVGIIKAKADERVKEYDSVKLNDKSIVLESIKPENKLKKNKIFQEKLDQDDFMKEKLAHKEAERLYNGTVQDNNLNDKADNADEIENIKTIKNRFENKKMDKNLVNDEEENIQKRSLSLYRKIALSFVILTVLLLVVIIYFSLVKVTIILTSNQEQVSSDLNVDIFDQDRSSGSKGGILGVIKQVDIERSKICQATDTELISEEITGKAIIINNHSSLQQLVATTRLLSPDNKLFRTKKTVFVPAGGQVEVEVYADELGRDMAIDPTRFTIPGLWAGLQDKIYAESKEPMRYSRQIKKYIKQDDIDSCVQDLKVILLSSAKAEANENYQTHDQIIFDIDDNSITRQIDGAVGEERDEFKIIMKTTIAVVAFMDDEIYKLAKQKLLAVMPDDKQLLSFKKDDISYVLNDYNINKGTALLNINFAGKMVAKSGYSIIDRTKLINLNEKQIGAYLDSLPEVFDYEIKFYPSFIKKAPSLADRIKIIIKQ